MEARSFGLAVRLPRGALFACACGLLASCSSLTPPGEINDLYRHVLEDRRAHYRIKEGDILAIRFYSPQHRDLDQEKLVVLPDGRCDLYFAHDLRVAGKTVSELEAELRERVGKEAREPEISLRVDPRPEKVYMVGQFDKPQVVDYRTDMTLGDAIAAVNSWRVTGKPSRAILVRPYMNPQRPDKFRISLYDESEEIFLLPGDRITLERNPWAAVVDWLSTHVFGVLGQNPLYYLTWLAL